MNYNLFGSSALAEFPKLDYEYVTTTEKALKCLEEIEKRLIIEFDTEATGLDPWLDRIVLMQFGIGEQRFVFDVRDGRVDPQIFNKVLGSDDNLTLIQNASFDYKMMKSNFNIEISNMYDTMLADELIFAGLNKKSKLDYLVAKYFSLNFPKDVATSFKDYDQEYQEYQLRYASNDVSVLKDIYNLQIGELNKQGLERVAKLEFEFVIPLSDMELNGITLDTTMWKEVIKETEDNKNSTKIIIDNALKNTVDQHALFGLSLVNLDSPSQLGASLSRLGIYVDGTAVEELQKHRQHEIVDHILNYREYEKFLTTYGETMLAKIHPLTHRLHTRFKQMVSTGRLSSSHPNLQNIPNGQKYRSCFVAKEGYKLITADMSQAELRIIAEYSLDPVFLEVYRTGQDLHTRTASDVFGLSILEVVKDKKLPETDSKKVGYRSKVKPISFGLCYGLTKFGLARRLRISEKEAQKLIDKYFSKYRKVKSFLDKSGRDAVYNRYSTSISGRRRNYALPAPSDPDFSKIKGAIERAGKNHRIQGSNADTIKQAMIYTTKNLKGYDAKLLLSVHDEVVVETAEAEVEEVAKIVSQSLIDGFGEFFKVVKMEADSLVGDCWLKG